MAVVISLEDTAIMLTSEVQPHGSRDNTIFPSFSGRSPRVNLDSWRLIGAENNNTFKFSITPGTSALATELSTAGKGKEANMHSMRVHIVLLMNVASRCSHIMKSTQGGGI